MPNYPIFRYCTTRYQTEIAEVADTPSFWIGCNRSEQRTRIKHLSHRPKTVCLNSATAALELILRVLEVGPVWWDCPWHTASCSVITHAAPVMGGLSKADRLGMDMTYLSKLSLRKLRLSSVELAGIVCRQPFVPSCGEETGPLYSYPASGKRPLTVSWLFLIVPLWIYRKGNQLDLSLTLLPSFMPLEEHNCWGRKCDLKANPAIDDEEDNTRIPNSFPSWSSKGCPCQVQLGFMGEIRYRYRPTNYMTDIMASVVWYNWTVTFWVANVVRTSWITLWSWFCRYSYSPTCTELILLNLHAYIT